MRHSSGLVVVALTVIMPVAILHANEFANEQNACIDQLFNQASPQITVKPTDPIEMANREQQRRSSSQFCARVYDECQVPLSSHANVWHAGNPDDDYRTPWGRLDGP